MELRLTVVGADRRAHDCVVSCEPAATVATLTAALARRFTGTAADTGGDAGAAICSLACARLGGLVPNELPVAASGISDGDLVELSPRATPVLAGPAALLGLRAVSANDRYLAVRRGPAAGQWLALGRGRHILGRGSGADLSINDPTVSRAMAELHVDEEVEIVGLAGHNPVRMDGIVIERSRQVLPGSVIGIGESELVLTGGSSAAGTVGMHRPPRHINHVEGADVALPLPPGQPGRNRFPFLSIAVGLLGGAVIALLFRSVIWIVFLLLTPLTATASYFESRLGNRAERREGARAWRARLGDAVRSLDIAHERERVARLADAPSPSELAQRVARRATVWERSRSDGDALVARVGLGSQPARSRAVVDDYTGTATSTPELAQIVRRFADVHDVPITADLNEDRVIGIAGSLQSTAAAVMRSIVLQLASLVSPADLRIVAIVPSGAIDQWRWLRWLPHALNGSTDPLVCGEAAIARTIKELAGARDTGDDVPFTLLLVDDGAELSRPALGRLLQDIGGSRLRVIWQTDNAVRLPPQCTLTIADSSTTRDVAVVRPGSGERVVARAEGVDLASADHWSRAIAPLRDLTAPVDAVASLARLAPLPLVLGELAVRDEPALIAARWSTGRPVEAPIGLGVDGVMSLDLRTDGPHALVAGTTGSGKSELLQSWIAALAATLSPARLQLLLVDYKGGAAFRECSELPHTGGFITDLTPHLARRALTALNAELRRREGILNAHRAKDLVDLERRDLSAAPPSLVLVIDEFAALAGEIPEFVDGVIDIAQRGRSLGIHLVLATQRPTGVITGSIQANTNLRIALRTAPGESDDVIGTSEAEAIDTPGRAYVRVGARKPVPVQVAYAGGTTVASDGGSVFVTAWGSESDRDSERSTEQGDRDRAVSGRAADASPTAPAPASETASDLQRIVASIDAAWRAAEEELPPSPIPPALPEVLPLSSITPDAALVRASTLTGIATFGTIDEPESQRQYDATIDFERDGGLLIFGATGAGKSVAIRTLVGALARASDADGLTVYGIDAARGLRPLADLPQVAEIVALDDSERVARLFAIVRAEVDSRAHLFAAEAVTSLREHMAKTAQPLPRIVIVIDGATAFLSTYGTHAFGYLDEELARLANEGRSVGVHVVLAADRFASVPSELRAAFRRRLVLRQSSVDEYNMLGLRVSEDEIDMPAGRGFIDGSEVQVALVGNQPDGASQFQAFEELASELTRRSPHRASPIPVLADDVAATDLPPPTRALEPVVGLANDLALAPYRLALWDDHLIIAGPPRSGRSSLATLIANQLARHGTRVIVGSPAGRGVGAVASTVVSWVGTETIEQGLEALSDRLGVEGDEPLVVIVDDWHELHETPLDERLMSLVRAGRDRPLRVVVTCDNHVARRPFTSVLDSIRRTRHGIVLQPTSDDEMMFDVVLPLKNRRYPPGRGVVVRRDSSTTIVQFARP